MGKSEQEKYIELIEQQKKQIESLTQQLDDVKDENEELRTQVASLEIIIKDSEEDSRDKQEAILNDQKRINFAEAKALEWESITNDLSHTISTHITNAANILYKAVNGNIFDYNEVLIRALINVKRVKSLSDLIYNYNKLDEVVKRFKIKDDLDLVDIIKDRLDDVRNSLETLHITPERISILSHLEIRINCSQACPLTINEQLEEVPGLIITDLLRNAFKYSSDNNPNINISVTDNGRYYIVDITNNRSPKPESTSLKSGLKIVMRFAEILGISFVKTEDSSNDNITFTLRIPKNIRYGKNKNLTS